MKTIFLKYFISKKGYTIKSLAKPMGMDVSTLSQKINNKRPLSINEAKRLISLLDIGMDDAWDIFFCDDMYGNAQREEE